MEGAEQGKKGKKVYLKLVNLKDHEGKGVIDS